MDKIEKRAIDVAELINAGKKEKEICDILNISNKQYERTRIHLKQNRFNIKLNCSFNKINKNVLKNINAIKNLNNRHHMKVDQITNTLGISKYEYYTAMNYINSESKMMSQTLESPIYKVMKTANEQIRINITDGTIIVFTDSHVIPNEYNSVAAEALINIIKSEKPDYVCC